MTYRNVLEPFKIGFTTIDTRKYIKYIIICIQNKIQGENVMRF